MNEQIGQNDDPQPGSEQEEKAKFAEVNFARARNTPEENAAPIAVPQKPKRNGPEAFARMMTPPGVTPDQGCFAIILGSVLLLGSLTFWLIVYFRNAPEFQPDGTRQGPTAGQIESERAESRKQRLNP